MKLNVNECKIMHKKENNPNCTYMMMGSQIDMTQERDLGVIIKISLKHQLCGQNSKKMNREQITVKPWHACVLVLSYPFQINIVELQKI